MNLFQAIETTHIIENSSNPETVIGRCLLLKNRFESLERGRITYSFSDYLELSIDKFKRTYPEKSISEVQLQIIKTAPDITTYLSDNFIRCLKAYTEKEVSEIALIEKDTAKDKRNEKLNNYIEFLKPDIEQVFDPLLTILFYGSFMQMVSHARGMEILKSFKAIEKRANNAISSLDAIIDRFESKIEK